MRDVIEHIYNKKSALKNLYSLLNDNGFMFVAFPLKYSPYAGHQQTSNTWLKYMIYILLYPSFLRRFLCKFTNEENRIEELLYLRKCALTYRKFKKLIQEDWKIHDVKFFISRPIYKQRFGWPIVKMVNIPILRELSNGCELIIKKNHNIV
jgi:2-polyprenyl-3-methyl-5-hydroxy-6-metoxy-1,4-benzoquinol methylase